MALAVLFFVCVVCVCVRARVWVCALCVCRMPLFIVTALYCLTAGKAEVAFCAGSHLAGRAP
eukprot:SAG22_NODE_7795_length_708_cov_0.694581_2_plen_61_part_01